MEAILLASRDAVAQGLLYGLMTLGVYISYKMLDFADLSVDGTFALGGCVAAMMIARGQPPVFAVLLALLAGMVGGAVTGLLNTKLEIPGILAGILTQLGLYSINLRIMGRANTPLLQVTTLFDQVGRVLPLSRDMLYIVTGLLFCAVVIGLMYWFFGTEIGCSLRATGDNSHMARALGTNTDTMVILGLMLSNGLVALSGALVAQYQGSGDVRMGQGTIVTGLASIIIGGVVFRFLRGNFALKLLGAVLGSVLYRIVIAVVLQVGLNTDDLKLLTAIMVAIALSVPMVKRRLADAGRRRRDNHAET